MKNYKTAMWLAATALVIPTAVSAEDELSSAAKSVQNTLSKLTANSSEATVNQARTLYSNLSEDDQYVIYDVFVAKLIPLEAEFYNEAVEVTLAKKDTVTLAEVEALFAIYDEKEWEFQELVQEKYDLLYELLTYVENRPYKEAADAFIEKLRILDEGNITQQKYDDIALIYSELDYMSYDYFDSAVVDEKLERLQKRLYQLEAQEVQKLINRAEEATITQEHLDTIVAAYHDLSYEAQQSITNYEKVDSLQNYIWAAPTRDEAKRLQTLINNMNEKTADYSTLVALIEEITYADTEVYELLTNVSKLDSLLVTSKKTEAATVQALIDALQETNVTYDALDAIEEAYALLDYEVQQVVTNYAKVDTLTTYIMNEEAVAMEVEAFIYQLTADSTIEELNAAQQKIDQLSAVAKTFITVETTEALQALYAQKEAAPVQALIDAIDESNVTAEALSAIEEAYAKLAPNIQQLVIDYDKVAQLKQYVVEEKAIASDFEARITKIGSDATLAEVEALLIELEGLSAVAQSALPTDKIAALKALHVQLTATNNEETVDTNINADIANIWGATDFSDNVKNVKAAFAKLSTEQQAQANGQTLLRYEQMATYWNVKTKKWTNSPQQVEATKEWTVTFSAAILNTPDNLAHIKVFSQQGVAQNIVTTIVGKNNDQLIVTLNDVTYTQGEQYVLIIGDTLKSDGNVSLTNGEWQYFVVK